MKSIVVMGVAGCGKSSLGAALARAQGMPLVEGDDFHSLASRRKMHDGIALTDADRKDWLDILGRQLRERPGIVLTCSALKKKYREVLRAALPGLRFVFLELGRDAAAARVAGRGGGHFFSVDLVDSQFAALESPADEPGVVRLDATLDLPELTRRAVELLGNLEEAR